MILLDVEPLRGSRAYVTLRCGFSEPVIETFKAIPGVRWVKERRVWIAPAETTPILMRRLEKAKIAKIRRRFQFEDFWLPDVEVDDEGLYKYQLEGATFLAQRTATLGAGFLADDLGLGKSVQALCALDGLDPKGETRTLVLCPAVVVEHWREEVKRWLGEPATRLRGERAQWEGIGVCSYDTFRSMTAKEASLSSADYVVMDEIHYLSNPRSQRSKAVRTYLRKTRPTGRIGLSGTPMLARPKDLWHPLDLLWPERFGNFFRFTGRYSDGHFEEIEGVEKPVWMSNGASNLDELGERLKSLMLRRVKSEVLELPERQRIVLPVKLPRDTVKAMQRAFTGIEGSEGIKNALTRVEEHKVSAACSLGADLLAQGRRPLFLTTRKETARKISEKLRAPVATGDVPPEKRKKVLTGGTGPAVSTIYAVTTGINLTGFDVICFVGLDWLPSTLLQAEARVHRIGQGKKVTYYYLIGLGTVDEVIRSRVIERLEHFVELMGGIGGDEDQLADDLGRKNEDELIAEIIAMVKRQVRDGD